MAWLGIFDPVSLLSLLGFVTLMWYYVHRKWQYFAERNIQTEKPSLLTLGTIGGASGQEMFTIHNKKKKKFGPIYGDYQGLNPVLVIHDVEIMRKIFISNFSDFQERQRAVAARLLGRELINSVSNVKGEKWKRMRTTISPSFTMSKLKHAFHIAENCATETVTILESKCKECAGKFTPKTILSNLALDMVISIFLGTKAHAQDLDSKGSRLAQETDRAFKSGFSSPLVISLYLFPSLKHVYDKFGIRLIPKDCLDYLVTYLRAAIKQRLENGEVEKKDLMQLLLDAKMPDKEINDHSVKGLTRDEVIGNLILMIGAGYENIAVSLVYLAYNLAFHKDVQEKLQKEVDEVVTRQDCSDYEVINSMKYLDMCVNESLRLYITTWTQSRICTKQTNVNGLTIPKDVIVHFPAFALAHDPEHWEDPWEFRPERMEDMSKIDPMVFQPFGAGPRNCIAKKLALMEIKITFFKLMQNFTLKPADDTPKPPLELDLGIAIRPAKQFPICAERRKQQ